MNGPEIWSTDGTEGGTALFKDIREGSLGSDPVRASCARSRRLHTALARSARAPDRESRARGRAQSHFTVMNGKLFFKATTATGSGSGQTTDLWMSDGTAAGTAMVGNQGDIRVATDGVRRNHVA